MSHSALKVEESLSFEHTLRSSCIYHRGKAAQATKLGAVLRVPARSVRQAVPASPVLVCSFGTEANGLFARWEGASGASPAREEAAAPQAGTTGPSSGAARALQRHRTAGTAGLPYSARCQSPKLTLSCFDGGQKSLGKKKSTLLLLTPFVLLKARCLFCPCCLVSAGSFLQRLHEHCTVPSTAIGTAQRTWNHE